jgi:hypothetical protein
MTKPSAEGWTKEAPYVELDVVTPSCPQHQTHNFYHYLRAPLGNLKSAGQQRLAQTLLLATLSALACD